MEHEHIFTKGVFNSLAPYISSRESDNLTLCTLIEDPEQTDSETIEDQYGDIPYKKLKFYKWLSREQKIKIFSAFFQKINPDIIHSQMSDGWDVAAAQLAGIPIVNTIHIGGIICARGGGNGFLDEHDRICSRVVGKECCKCIFHDIPYPKVANVLYHLIPNPIKRYFANRKKRILYLSALGITKWLIDETLWKIKIFKDSHFIAANPRLAEALAKNGIKKNVHIIPHGVPDRERLPFPPIEGKLKLFFLSRVQYSKGLHVIFKALSGIDPSKYEIHIIGDAGSSRFDQRYYRNLKKSGKKSGINAIIHGRISNADLESIVKDCHVLVMPTICMEVYGIAIAEALAMGRPVISSTCGGPQMQITEDVNGWLVPPNDPISLRKRIQTLIDNPLLVENASKNAQLPHPVENYVKSLHNLYKSISGK